MICEISGNAVFLDFFIMVFLEINADLLSFMSSRQNND